MTDGEPETDPTTYKKPLVGLWPKTPHLPQKERERGWRGLLEWGPSHDKRRLANTASNWHVHTNIERADSLEGGETKTASTEAAPGLRNLLQGSSSLHIDS